MTNELATRLRAHVVNRGGTKFENGAWSMMLEAAEMLEQQAAIIKTWESTK